MKILALIPARMGSSRFPGKPMVKIHGKPMIGDVFKRVARSPLLDTVAVATCDQEIVDYIESIGGTAVMTSNRHERASDRCAEALLKLEQSKGIRYDIVVIVQGDEPMIHPDMIAEAIQPLLDHWMSRLSIRSARSRTRVNSKIAIASRWYATLNPTRSIFRASPFRLAVRSTRYQWVNRFALSRSGATSCLSTPA